MKSAFGGQAAAFLATDSRVRTLLSLGAGRRGAAFDSMVARANVRFGSLADIQRSLAYFRLPPKADMQATWASTRLGG